MWLTSPKVGSTICHLRQLTRPIPATCSIRKEFTTVHVTLITQSAITTTFLRIFHASRQRFIARAKRNKPHFLILRKFLASNRYRNRLKWVCLHYIGFDFWWGVWNRFSEKKSRFLFWNLKTQLSQVVILLVKAITMTIIQTGITCKKTPFTCATQLAGDLFLEKLKYFVSYIHPRRCEKM